MTTVTNVKTIKIFLEPTKITV